MGLMEFQVTQYQFAAHIRNPKVNPAPAGIEDRRLAVYRDLFYNNVESFIASGFPVLRSLCDDGYWHQMVREFFATHHCKSPYFLEIGEEFLAYLQHERTPKSDDFPFLLELAHYEWVELALEIAEDELPATGVNPRGDLMLGVPVISPLACVLSYHYPVHRISDSFIPEQPPEQPTFLVVHRDHSDVVRFVEINAVTARLFDVLKENPLYRGEQAVDQVIKEIEHPQPVEAKAGGAEALELLRRSGVILGTALQAVE